jgi:hypothetical protein
VRCRDAVSAFRYEDAYMVVRKRTRV